MPLTAHVSYPSPLSSNHPYTPAVVPTPALSVQTSALSMPTPTPSSIPVSTSSISIYTPSNVASTPQVPIPSPQLAGPSGTSGHGSPFAPSDSLSPIVFSETALQSTPQTPSLLMNFPSSRGLIRSTSNPSIRFRNSGSTHWTSERQQAFEYRLARLTASAGLSLSWIENIEFITLIEELAPGAYIPSRKVLTTRIIPDLVKNIQTANKKKTEHGFVTLQADGWTAKNNRHFIAFMITLISQVSLSIGI